MNCPHCSSAMGDVTQNWHAFAESAGAEYLATYVTIWHCPSCLTMAGSAENDLEWVIEPVQGNPETGNADS
ncbi:MAG: hypothetical protein ACRDFX_12805 [Chloroflexota bacterium]